MKTIPRWVLSLLATLPEGQPARIVFHTNGKGEWKAETTLYHGACLEHDVVRLESHEEPTLTKM